MPLKNTLVVGWRIGQVHRAKHELRLNGNLLSTTCMADGHAYGRRPRVPYLRIQEDVDNCDRQALRAGQQGADVQKDDVDDYWKVLRKEGQAEHQDVADAQQDDQDKSRSSSPPVNPINDITKSLDFHLMLSPYVHQKFKFITILQ